MMRISLNNVKPRKARKCEATGALTLVIDTSHPNYPTISTEEITLFDLSERQVNLIATAFNAAANLEVTT